MDVIVNWWFEIRQEYPKTTILSNGDTQYLAKLNYVTHLDFPQIRGFPFLSYLLGWGRVKSLQFDQKYPKPPNDY